VTWSGEVLEVGRMAREQHRHPASLRPTSPPSPSSCIPIGGPGPVRSTGGEGPSAPPGR
jgi:hypothetical protein